VRSALAPAPCQTGPSGGSPAGDLGQLTSLSLGVALLASLAAAWERRSVWADALWPSSRSCSASGCDFRPAAAAARWPRGCSPGLRASQLAAPGLRGRFRFRLRRASLGRPLEAVLRRLRLSADCACASETETGTGPLVAAAAAGGRRKSVCVW